MAHEHEHEHEHEHGDELEVLHLVVQHLVNWGARDVARRAVGREPLRADEGCHSRLPSADIHRDALCQRNTGRGEA